MSAIQDSFALLKSSIVLSEYIGQDTKLKSMGSKTSFRGACPIHGGANQSSFSVDDDKGLWKCFTGCGGGSIIDYWLKRHDSTDLSEAVEALAEHSGVKLPEREGGKDDGVSISRMKAAVKAVSEACIDHLFDSPSSEAARAWDYLDERKIDEEIIEAWHIGLIPSGKSGVEFILSASDDKKALVEAGVLGPSKNGGFWSPFSGRLIFPILDGGGVPIAFGGRAIPGVESFGDKYINPHESRLYSKSKVMYGMHLLTTKPKRVIVGEGYLDAIAVHSAGASGVIGMATCGTSLTTGQVEILGKAKEVVFMYDGDAAGQKAIAGSYWAANKLGAGALGHLLKDDQDPWDMYLSSKKQFRSMLSGNFPHLVTAAVDAKMSGSESDVEFDQWVSTAIASLVRSDHKDNLLRAAARLRGQSSRDYARGLTAGRPKRHDREDGPVVALDPAMRSLATRVLQMTDSESDAVFAAIRSWDQPTESAVRSWLPISSEVDIDVFRSLINGPTVTTKSPEVDRAVAECMSEPDAPTESISIVLRNLIDVLLADAESICVHPDVPPALVSQVMNLHKITEVRDDIVIQTDALAYLIDLVVDLGRWRSITDNAE